MPAQQSKTKQLAKLLGLIERFGSDPGFARKKIEQGYRYLLVLDFESTCWKDSRKVVNQEIIEFPAVLLDVSSGKLVSQFHQYVQPSESPRLSDFCRELTGITQRQVDDGVPIATCLHLFSKWIDDLRTKYSVYFAGEDPAVPVKPRRANAFAQPVATAAATPPLQQPLPTHHCALATWSDWDLGVCLLYECRRKQLRKLQIFNQWIDIRAAYKMFYNRKPKGLAGALSELRMTFDGREHCGLDDAKNTALLCYRMGQDGHRWKITKTLESPQSIVRRPVGTSSGVGSRAQLSPGQQTLSAASPLLPPAVARRPPSMSPSSAQASKATAACCVGPARPATTSTASNSTGDSMTSPPSVMMSSTAGAPPATSGVGVPTLQSQCKTSTHAPLRQHTAASLSGSNTRTRQTSTATRSRRSLTQTATSVSRTSSSAMPQSATTDRACASSSVTNGHASLPGYTGHRTAAISQPRDDASIQHHPVYTDNPAASLSTSLAHANLNLNNASGGGRLAYPTPATQPMAVTADDSGMMMPPSGCSVPALPCSTVHSYMHTGSPCVTGTTQPTAITNDTGVMSSTSLPSVDGMAQPPTNNDTGMTSSTIHPSVNGMAQPMTNNDVGVMSSTLFPSVDGIAQPTTDHDVSMISSTTGSAQTASNAYPISGDNPSYAGSGMVSGVLHTPVASRQVPRGRSSHAGKQRRTTVMGTVTALEQENPPAMATSTSILAPRTLLSCDSSTTGIGMLGSTTSTTLSSQLSSLVSSVCRTTTMSSQTRRRLGSSTVLTPAKRVCSRLSPIASGDGRFATPDAVLARHRVVANSSRDGAAVRPTNTTAMTNTAMTSLNSHNDVMNTSGVTVTGSRVRSTSHTSSVASLQATGSCSSSDPCVGSTASSSTTPNTTPPLADCTTHTRAGARHAIARTVNNTSVGANSNRPLNRGPRRPVGLSPAINLNQAASVKRTPHQHTMPPPITPSSSTASPQLFSASKSSFTAGSNLGETVLAPETPRPTSINGGSITPPMCACGKRVRRCVASNPGPNQGRTFYTCVVKKRSGSGGGGLRMSPGRSAGCGYFQWESKKFVESHRASLGDITNSFRAQGSRQPSTPSACTPAQSNAAASYTGSYATPAGDSLDCSLVAAL